MTRQRFTPPPDDQASVAWSSGLDDGRNNRPQSPPTDRTLRGLYLAGFHRGVQLNQQATYGPPPTEHTAREGNPTP